MIATGKLQRLLLILDQVRQAPSFAQLQQHLERNGHLLSSRTLQRDVELMRSVLGLDVRYDREKNTYQLAGQEAGRDRLLGLLERATLGELLVANTGDLRQLVTVVQLQDQDALQGLVHWAALAKAAQERRWVNVQLRPLAKGAPSTLKVRALMLREQGGQWTFWGQGTGSAPTAVPLALITGLSATIQRFTAAEQSTLLARLNGKGTAMSTKGTRVVLLTSAEQGPAWVAAPLHGSQKLLKSAKDGWLFELTCPLDEALTRTLMGHGAALRVLEPAALVKTIAKAHKAAAKQYK
jgi:predicted DNA-binding transcriptional regulator YafY